MATPSSSTPPPPPPAGACAACSKAGAGPLLTCGRCHSAKYCCKECQKSHWASHKTQCKAMGLQSLQVICHRLVGGDMQAMGIELCNAIRQGVLGSVPFPAQWTSKDMATLTKLLKELSKTDQGLRPYYLLALPVYAMVLQPGELASCQATLQEVVDTLDGLNQPLDYEDFIVISLSIARCELLFTMGRYADSLAVARGVKPQVLQKARGENPFMYLKCMIRWLKLGSGQIVPEGGAAPSVEDPLLVEAEAAALDGLRLIERDEKLKPMLFDQLFEIATINEMMARFPMALSYSQRARALLDPSPSPNRFIRDVVMVAGLLRKCGQRQDADDILQQALHLSETNAAVTDQAKYLLYSHLGAVLSDGERYAEAIPYLEGAFRIMATTGMGRRDTHLTALKLANAYEAVGRMEEAVHIDEILLRQGAINAGSIARRAMSLLEQGEKAPAVECLREHIGDLEAALVQERHSIRSKETTRLNYRPFVMLSGLLQETGDGDEARRLMGVVEGAQRHEEEVRSMLLEETRRELVEVAREEESRRRSKKRGKRGRKKKRGGGEEKSSAAAGGGGGGKEEEEELVESMEEKLKVTEDRGGEEASGDECAICLNDLAVEEDEDDDDGSGPTVVEATCKHRFHKLCLDTWEKKCVEKKVKALCPLCRGSL